MVYRGRHGAGAAAGPSGVSKVINGPIPYAPDGLPLIGPMPGVPNAFEACVFTFGIAQGGGAGKVLAEWITEGETEWDMWAVDPRRYTDYTDHDYCDRQGHGDLWPRIRDAFPASRMARRARQEAVARARPGQELGGVMGAYNGWERANWFAKPGDDTSWKPPQPGAVPARGSRASAKNAKRCAMLAACWTCPAFPVLGAGHGRGRLAARFCTGGMPESGPDEPGLLRRQPRPDPDRDVLYSPGRGRLRADHRGPAQWHDGESGTALGARGVTSATTTEAGSR